MTIIDIAKTAGVSKSTVSRVINGHRTVDPVIARRVRSAMDDIGFVPKANRRGPKPKPPKVPGFRTGNIGLLLMGRTRRLLELPYIARQLAGITEAVQVRGINLMVLEMPQSSDVPRVVRERGVDGLVVTGAEISQKIVDALHPTPCVWLGGGPLALEITDHVVPNNPAAGILAARYLLERGCNRMAYVNNVPSHSDFPVRRDAFLGVLRERHRVELFETSTDEPEVNLWRGERMRADLGRLVTGILKRKEIPTGFFLPTDQQASMFQRLMADRGLEPEKEFFTVSCNRDEPWLATMHPRAATIDTRPFELGRAATRQLMRRIENPTDEVVTITVRPELVVPEAGRTEEKP